MFQLHRKSTGTSWIAPEFFLDADFTLSFRRIAPCPSPATTSFVSPRTTRHPPSHRRTPRPCSVRSSSVRRRRASRRRRRTATPVLSAVRSRLRTPASGRRTQASLEGLNLHLSASLAFHILSAPSRYMMLNLSMRSSTRRNVLVRGPAVGCERPGGGGAGARARWLRAVSPSHAILLTALNG